MSLNISWKYSVYVATITEGSHNEECYRKALAGIFDIAGALKRQYSIELSYSWSDGGSGLQLMVDGVSSECGRYMARLAFLAESHLLENSFRILQGPDIQSGLALLETRRWVAQPLLTEMEEAVRQQRRIDDAKRTSRCG